MRGMTASAVRVGGQRGRASVVEDGARLRIRASPTHPVRCVASARVRRRGEF